MIKRFKINWKYVVVGIMMAFIMSIPAWKKDGSDKIEYMQLQIDSLKADVAYIKKDLNSMWVNMNGAYIPVRFFTSLGEMQRDGLRIFTDAITYTPSSGVVVIDVSAAGFTTVQSVNVIAERNTSSATQCAQVLVKSFTSTSITVNITEGSNNLVTILGLSVLGGPATVFSSTSVKLHIFAIGK